MTAAQNTLVGGTVTGGCHRANRLLGQLQRCQLLTYVLKASGGTTITLSAAGQNVTTGADGADTINEGVQLRLVRLTQLQLISSRLMMVAALRV